MLAPDVCVVPGEAKVPPARQAEPTIEGSDPTLPDPPPVRTGISSITAVCGSALHQPLPLKPRTHPSFCADKPNPFAVQLVSCTAGVVKFEWTSSKVRFRAAGSCKTHHQSPGRGCRLFCPRQRLAVMHELLSSLYRPSLSQPSMSTQVYQFFSQPTAQITLCRTMPQ